MKKLEDKHISLDFETNGQNMDNIFSMLIKDVISVGISWLEEGELKTSAFYHKIEEKSICYGPSKYLY
jgi:hypothetical protein